MVAAVTLVLVVVVIGAALVTRGGSDSEAASPGTDPTTTATSFPIGSGPTSPATDATPPKNIEVRPPIALSQTGDFGTGLVVKIVGITSVQSQARAPGDIAGPALRVELEATNRSNHPISLESAQVGVEYGADRTPASINSGPGTKRFAPSLAPQKTSTAAYVFRVPPDQRDPVRVVVSYSLDAPTIVFEGSTA
jgi:hypothetical protein